MQPNQKNDFLLVLVILIALIGLIIDAKWLSYNSYFGILLVLLTAISFWLLIYGRIIKDIDEGKGIKEPYELYEALEKSTGNTIVSLKLRFIYNELCVIKNKFKAETKRQNQIGNLNLFIGILTTIFSVTILFITLFNPPPIPNVSASDKLISYLPRFFLALFIEIFSFFFLRLYRKTLDDIKFISNERTNVELKLIALETAIFNSETIRADNFRERDRILGKVLNETDRKEYQAKKFERDDVEMAGELYSLFMKKDDETLNNVLIELSKTERNFTLKKGETTAEIENEKINSKADHDLFAKFLETFFRIEQKEKKEKHA